MSLYKIDVLENWAKECVKQKIIPLSVTIEIADSGEVVINYTLDGRKLRNKFINWCIDRFSEITGIAPNWETQKERNLRWVQPIEAMLTQALFTAGVDYKKLKRPEDKYTKVHAQTFVLVIRDSWNKAKESGLTIANPQALKKVGINVAATGNHYQTARAMVGAGNSGE